MRAVGVAACAAARGAVSAGVPPSAVGVYVHEVGAARPLLEHNADRPMNPASTMKLLTTLAGLELLGPNFTWRTEAWLDGTLTGDVLQGNLVLKGYGDPKLTLEDLWLFLRELRARGLREIRGDLVLDRTFFAVEPIDPAQFDNDPTRPYNVGPDALLVNYKSVRLQFLPQEDTGDGRDTRHTRPAADQHREPADSGRAAAATSGRRSRRPIPEQARLVFTGVFPRGCGEK